MQIDHIFVFSKNKGIEADELVKFGFQEGSSRIHQGQGTTNRKFYFENFFLEILWVCNEKEIKSEPLAKTELWERSKFETSGYSPFGLCLKNTEDTDKIFRRSQVYQPAYFLKGFSIDFISSDKKKELPWLFRLPFRDKQNQSDEPIDHKNQIKKLTKAIFGLTNPKISEELVSVFQSADIDFQMSDELFLTLEFDNCKLGSEHLFKDFPLLIKY